MKKKIVCLISYCAFLVLGSGSVCGQLINGFPGVGDEFGAGETAKIRPPATPTLGSGTVVAVGPEPGSIGLAPSPNIQLGSEFGKNTVIRAYVGDGYAMGWISVTVGQSGAVTDIETIGAANSYLKPSGISTSSPNLAFSFNKFNEIEFRPNSGNGYNPWKATSNDAGAQPGDCGYINPAYLASSGSALVTCGRALFGMNSMTVSGVLSIQVCHHGGSRSPWMEVAHAGVPEDVYTSTRNVSSYDYNTLSTNSEGEYSDYPAGLYEGTDVAAAKYSKDDGVPLVQFTGLAMTDLKSQKATDLLTPFHSDKTKPDGDIELSGGKKDAEKIANYRRPTTVLIESGDHYFNVFDFKNIEWAFQLNTVDTVIDPHGPLGNCNSGHFRYFGITPEWNGSVVGTGETKIDGAVLLKKDAIVHVLGNVKDGTTDPASVTSSFGTKSPTFQTGVPDDKTDAILVLPDAVTGRFTLRIAGNLDKLNMVHDATDADKYYAQADFPENSLNVYMYPDLSGGEWTFAKAGLDAEYNTVDRTSHISKPPIRKTPASVFGIYGNYLFEDNNAQIHTTAKGPTGNTAADEFEPYVDGKDNNPGVIEIGDGYYNGVGVTTEGYENLHIYSGGILKNFESIVIRDAFNIQHSHVTANFTMNFTTEKNTPNFYIDNTAPLSILNYGSNGAIACDAGITFGAVGIAMLETSLADAINDGALQIQALGPVIFEDVFTPVVGTTNNELDILSDKASVIFKDALTYTNNGDSSFIIYAQGKETSILRSCISICSGGVWFQGETSIEQKKKGFTLIRSEYDDVVMDKNFTYTNSTKADENGEIMIQAGQDIYGAMTDGLFTFTQAGSKSILLEAKNSIHIKHDLTFDREKAVSGDITLAAGYDDDPFSVNAKTVAFSTLGVGLLGHICSPDDYTNRLPCGTVIRGDIWLEGPVMVDLSAAASPGNDIKTTFRAWNSVYLDHNFTYNQGAADGGNFLVFAQTGNVEAILNNGTKVLLDVTNKDNTGEIRVQAGNLPDELCAVNPCTDAIDDDAVSAFDGNVLFGKPLEINNDGLGYTIISASRDIENQTGAPFDFTYTNPDLTAAFDMTAGRHIETHSPILFDYKGGATVTANITMQAGRLKNQVDGCADDLCKTIELGTNLSKGVNTPLGVSDWDNYKNTFSENGLGHGSILMFNPVTFKYDGEGTILMTALNGNIESDPYLHRGSTAGYNSAGNIHNAQLSFNHKGTGITRMEAIDIKLHDKIAYNGVTTAHAADKMNGQFYMTAFDSILTRNISYTNLMDTGSVFITTHKMKFDEFGNDLNCGSYNIANGGPGIHQGHIVLGYGADCSDANYNDSIVFDFNSTAANDNTIGANLFIRAGYEGFDKNRVTGKPNRNLFNSDYPNDRNKAYGGNITFDFMKINMAKGNGNAGGYTEISTPNGNIWGKDSLQYHGINGNLLVDAGLGSLDDTLRAVRWNKELHNRDNGAGTESTLNTEVPSNCGEFGQWRTGNIMMKGGSLNFNDVISNDKTAGRGNATFRTREGFIDTYDAFTVDSMSGHLLKYAAKGGALASGSNEWADVSERDFKYTPVKNSGSVFFGADDNIMLNYGYSNDAGNPKGRNESGVDGYLYRGVGEYPVAENRGSYVLTALTEEHNPYYSTSYMDNIKECRSIFNVNEDGYLWYRTAYTNDNSTWKRGLHRMYRGCDDSNGSNCSGFAGQCRTSNNFARPLDFDFRKDASSSNENIVSGGLGVVATNYIDMFTKFTYHGGSGSGMASVPGMNTLHGEQVAGYGLYIKSQFTAEKVERRRVTCEDCGDTEAFPIEGSSTEHPTTEWTYVGFHDDARIHANGQRALIEGPVVEFFGHAELDSWTERVQNKTKLTVKADSIIFHDSAIFAGAVELLPFTTGAPREDDMRYGVINDRGPSTDFYKRYGAAISMPNRNQPVLEFGYQRCNEPLKTAHQVHNTRSESGLEPTPEVGGDIIVTFKYDFSLPIQNTVVANHARISFLTDSFDRVAGGEYIDACVRTDLLRIRNKVEFYTDSIRPVARRGTLKMTSNEQMPSVKEAGIFPHHLHLEPGSELSLPGENSLIAIATTTIGGYGHIHEKVQVKANGIIAPGRASLMEGDCATSRYQGKLSIHDLEMEKDAVLRISLGKKTTRYNKELDIYEDYTPIDTLSVHDMMWLRDNVDVVVLPETNYIEPGCYLFLEYGDSLGVSRNYASNLNLVEKRYGEYYFNLDISVPGKVYLCVTTFPMPSIQRYIDIPLVDGVTTSPTVGRYYVLGHRHFTFTASFSGDPLKISAVGHYTGEYRDLDEIGKILSDNTYQYTIFTVLEPWTVSIGPGASTVSNDGIFSHQVWSSKDILYVNVENDDIVSIYNMTGALLRREEVSGGMHRFTLERGAYVVTLKNGVVHKIMIN